MNASCEALDFRCRVGDVASGALDDAIQNMADAVMEAFGRTVASMGTLWVNIGTPNLTASGGSSSVVAPGSAAPGSQGVVTVLGYATWMGLVVAGISMVVLGGLVATRLRRGEGVAAVGRIGVVLAAVVLIGSAAGLVSALLPAGPTGAGGTVLFLQSSLWWYMGAAAAVSIVIGGVRMAWEQRAEPGRDTIRSLLTLIVVSGAGVTVVGLLVTAADSFAVWIINNALDCDVTAAEGACFGQSLLTLIALTTNPQAGGLGPLLVIILGLVALLASLFQMVLMVARGAMLVILTGILPLAASATNTEMGKAWFRRCIGWLVAFILYKPAAAIVYAAAFQLTGTNLFRDDGTGVLAVVTGLMLMVLALFALPALMRFVTPLVGTMAGGAGGAVLAAGALAALPSGASAVGRLASGSGSGGSGGPSGGGSNGPPAQRVSSESTGSTPSTGSTSSTGLSGGGSSGSGGSPGAGPSGGGPSGPNGSSGPTGTGSTGSSGSSGSSGAAGGGTSSGTSGTGSSGSTGLAGAAPAGGAGSAPAAPAAASAGGASGASAGAGAGAAAGGASAGGGAAAAGAAGGPVGVAVGAAADGAAKAGQAAIAAAKNVGDDATGEGNGPDGSR